MISTCTPIVADLGLGNLRSVERAVEAATRPLGLAPPLVTREAETIARAKLLIVPGQGAFRDAALALDEHGSALRQAIASALSSGAHYLGICLGLQLLFESSDEAPSAKGLGFFSGRVVALADDLLDADGRRLKVPHMGWNQPKARSTPAGDRIAPLLAAAGEAPWFYFVHSYAAHPADASVLGAVADYGTELTAAVARDRVVATQFHPEKSQRAGLAFLRAFVARALEEGSQT